MKYLVTLTTGETPYLYNFVRRSSEKFVLFSDLSFNAIPEGVEYEMALELTKNLRVHSHTIIDCDMTLSEIGDHYNWECYQLLQNYKPIKNYRFADFNPEPKVTTDNETFIQYGYSIRIDVTDNKSDYLQKKDYKKGYEYAHISYVRHLLNEYWFASQQTLEDLKDYFKVTTKKLASHQLALLAENTKKPSLSICYRKGLKDITSNKVR